MNNIRHALVAQLAAVGPTTSLDSLFRLSLLASDLGITSNTLNNEIAQRVQTLPVSAPLHQLFALTKMQKAPTGGTDVGQLAEYPLGGPEKIRIGGRVYLEMGAIENDPQEFDAAYWEQWRGSFGMSLPFDTSMTGATLVGFAVKDNRICAVGFISSAYYAWLSDDDGITWTRVTIPTGGQPLALYALAGRFYVSVNGGALISSLTGDNGSWVSVLPMQSGRIITSMAAKGSLVMVAGTKASNTPVIYTSTNGTAFAEVSAPTFSGAYIGLSYDPVLDRWFVASSTTGNLYDSRDDGASWTMRQALGSASVANLAGVVRLSGGLFAVANSRHVWKFNGTNWDALGEVSRGLAPVAGVSVVVDGALVCRLLNDLNQIAKTSDFQLFTNLCRPATAYSLLAIKGGDLLFSPNTPTGANSLYRHWLTVVAGSVYRSTVTDHKKYVRIK